MLRKTQLGQKDRLSAQRTDSRKSDSHRHMAQQQPRGARSSRSDDALSLLHWDHEQAQSLYEGFQTAGGDDRYFLASRILKTLEQHAKIERELVYPVIQARAMKQNHKQGEALARTAFRDHQALLKRVAKIKDLLIQDEGYQARIDELMEQVQHHVEQEEQELFPIRVHLRVSWVKSFLQK